MYGTLSVLDQLKTIRTPVAEYGEDNIWQGLDLLIQAHNEMRAELAGDLVTATADRLRSYGTTADMVMDEIAEFAQPDAQKFAPTPYDVAFPLRLYGASLQWTRKYFQNTPVSELARQIDGIFLADTRAYNRELKRAVFRPTNTTFIDRLVDNVSLPVRAFVNADGNAIPMGPNGQTFNGATHTHYLARAGGSLAASDVSALIDTILEHYNVGQIRVYINLAQETAIRGFTSNFTGYTDARLILPSTTQQATGRTLDIMNVGNRAIGIFDEAEVWVKPWVPANYMFAFNTTAPKPIAERTRPGSGGLELVYDDEAHPLRARSYEHEFGMAPAERTNGAVLYTANTTYTMPTITA